MHFYAFDSFKGLPPLSVVDSEIKQFEQGQYHSTKTQFINDLSREKFDMKRLHIIEGWFDQTLTEKLHESLILKAAAVIMIDCDLYTSAVPVMEFITPYLKDGTILLFDDWFCFNASPDRGEQKACNNWLKKNSDIKLIPYLPFEGYGMSFIVNM